MPREKKIDMVILGLLSHEDLTGYDIKKRMDGVIRFFWKGSYGNIYPALKNLESNGLIVKIDTSLGRRERLTYHITTDGRDALKGWLQEEQASNELRYETLLKLFFGGAGNQTDAVRHIETFEAQIANDLNMLKAYCAALEGHLEDQDHLYYYLTASFGVDTYEAYLKWCTKAKGMLQ